MKTLECDEIDPKSADTITTTHLPISSSSASEEILEHANGQHGDNVVVLSSEGEVLVEDVEDDDDAGCNNDAYLVHPPTGTIDSLGDDSDSDEILNTLALINQQYAEQHSQIQQERRVIAANVGAFHIPGRQQQQQQSNNRNSQNYYDPTETTPLDQPATANATNSEEYLDVPPPTHSVEAFLVVEDNNATNENENAVVTTMLVPSPRRQHQIVETPIIIATVDTPTADRPNRLKPLFIVVIIVLVGIIIGIIVYLLWQQNIGSETSYPSSNPSSNPSSSPSSSPVYSSTVDKVCFESTYELRNAVIKYLDGDDDVKRTYGNQIGSWCVGKIQDFSDLFNRIGPMDRPFFNEKAIDFNEDIGQWNTSSASTMALMFAGTAAFNQDISRWDVSKVRDLRYMFQDATGFNQNLSSWNVSAVTAMEGLFTGAVLFNGDISSWDVSSITNTEDMFYKASSFNQDIAKWDVSKVTKMCGMFSSATNFNQNLSSWNVSRVTEMSQMFHSASKFNQDIYTWNVSNAVRMDLMFAYSSTFSQDLCPWGGLLFIAGTNTSSMFASAISCPNNADPDLNDDPPGPLCHVCT